MTIVRNYLLMCTCAVVYSSYSYYLRVVFISFRAPDCVATIQGWQLFKGSVYLKKYGMQEHTDCECDDNMH